MKVEAKLQKVMDKGYVELTDIQFVEALMYVFHVPKGTTDIRMVYNGTKLGLNVYLFAPWFALPTADTMARWAICGSYLTDNYWEDCFLNFLMHKDIQKFCGVYVMALFPELSLIADES